MNHKTDMQAELRRVASELRAYNPAADEYKGEHIHKVWAREIEAAIAGQSAGVPTGYALVLIEPTVEMIAALGFAGDADIAIGHARAFKETVDAYASMIAAAPAPVSEPEQPSERIDQECPHGVDDGACKQCYGEAVRGEQGAVQIARSYFDEAYKTACASSQPDAWMQAALLARQLCNAMDKAASAPTLGEQPQAAEPKGLSEKQREALEYALYALRQMTSIRSDEAREVISALLANGE